MKSSSTFLGRVTPAADWPLRRHIVLRDAYLRNPIKVQVTRHANADHIIAEDAVGIVYYARTDRIEGFSLDGSAIDEDFADILG